MIQSILSFALLAGVLTLVPGIDTTLVLRTAISRGQREAFVALCGIATGVFIWGAAAAVGISAILLLSETAFAIVKYAGAAYLLYMGIQLLRNAKKNLESEDEGATSKNLWKTFLRGLMTNILNPKVGVFYMAVLPQFLWPEAPSWLAGLILASVHVVEGLIWLSFIIIATGFARTWLGKPHVRSWIDRIAGAALIGFGFKTALNI